MKKTHAEDLATVLDWARTLDQETLAQLFSVAALAVKESRELSREGLSLASQFANAHRLHVAAMREQVEALKGRIEESEKGFATSAENALQQQSRIRDGGRKGGERSGATRRAKSKAPSLEDLQNERALLTGEGRPPVGTSQILARRHKVTVRTINRWLRRT